MRSRAGLGRKRIFGVFRAQRTCLVAASVNLPPPADGGVNNVPLNPLAGFKGPLRRGGRWEDEGRGKKRNGKGWKGRENPKINYWSRPWFRIFWPDAPAHRPPRPEDADGNNAVLDVSSVDRESVQPVHERHPVGTRPVSRSDRRTRHCLPPRQTHPGQHQPGPMGAQTPPAAQPATTRLRVD